MGKHPEIDSLTPKTDFSRREFFVTTALATGFAMAVRPLAASTIVTPPHGLTMGEPKIQASDRMIPGYYAHPETGSNFPVTLVVQEMFGVHEHIKDVCRRLAKLGHLAVAPELFVRQGDAVNAPSVQAALAIANQASDAQVMGDLDAAVKWAANKGGDVTKLGITGFCSGGRTVWMYGAHNPNLKAGVAWYGHLVGTASAAKPLNPIDIAPELKAPILGLYAGKDPGIPLEHIGRMQQALKKANKNSEFVVYPDAQHGFNADYRPSYNEQAAKDGWRRMQDWFKKYGAA
jgi:carboxymethylenebutenolidase